ncbi:MAG: Ig-like domain-containing protein, partial [bacterium]
GRVVTWGSSNTAIATVSGTGLVTGVAAGSATITATSEGQNGTSTVTVTVPPVASVTVAPPTANIVVGGTAQLTATTKDAGGTVLTGRVVTWGSSNTLIATVSATGVVTGVAAGSATITATSEGQNGTSAVTVTQVPVASVTVTPPSANVTVGSVTGLLATPKDAGGTVLTGRLITWGSSNDAVATVSANGSVTAVALGTATITATSEGQSGTSAITVIVPPVASVAVAPPTASVQIGATAPLTATTKDAGGNVLTGRVVTWGSSNTGVATVSATGVVTAVAVGTATITATSEGQNGTSTITVIPVPVGSVTVAPTSASVSLLGTTALTATVKDANGVIVTDRTVTWSSDNILTATVSPTGVVTGLVPGNATITATSEGKSGSSALTVTLLETAAITVHPPAAVRKAQK